MHDNIHRASIKLRGTLLNIVNSGLSYSALNPLTLFKICQSVVIPRALYGCELWNSLSPGNILELDRAHSFCIKFIQKLPKNVKNDISYHSVGAIPIIKQIDYRKLQLLGQLCRLPCNYLAKTIFVHRLTRYLSGSERQSCGFIPDIFNILSKYELLQYINYFTETSHFPSKYVWKQSLKDMYLSLYL